MKKILVLALLLAVFPATADQFVVTCAPESGWDCSVVLEAQTNTTVNLANCFVPRPFTIVAGGAATENPTHLNCFSRSLQQIAIPATVRATTVARYVGGMVLALPAASYTPGVLRAGTVVNDGTDSTFVLAFNRSGYRAVTRIDVIDGGANFVGSEILGVDPGDFAFYQIKTPVAIGSLKFTPGSGVGVGGNTDAGEVIFYVVVGPSGGNAAPRIIIPEPAW